MMETFFDTHAHLDYPEFRDDLAGVVERARNAGITKIVAVGTDLESSRRALAMSETYREIYAVVGWHPAEAGRAPEDIRDDLRRLASHPRVIALGETGLDFRRLPSRQTDGGSGDDDEVKRKQTALYRQHLEIARETGLNCVIHQRDAFAETVQELEPFVARVRGVFHCFVDDAASQRRLQNLGCLVSFTGIATFKNAASVRETIAATPMDQMMLETDSPYLAPVPYRGKRCEPAYVREIAMLVCEIKGCTPAELSEATCQTAAGFFPKLRDIGG